MRGSKWRLVPAPLFCVHLSVRQLCLCQWRSMQLCVCVCCVSRTEDQLWRRCWMSECIVLHAISPSLPWLPPPDRDDICHHQDKVECGMTGISNLHNKQWNSNYQPAQTIFPAVTFGPQDCSIIHWHSRLAERKKKKKWKKEKIKRAREKEAEGLIY